MPRGNEFYWASAAGTDVGKVRELNEDGLLEQPQTGIWAVADGMGGYHAGDHASATVVRALAALKLVRPLDLLVEQAATALKQVNDQLLREGRQNGARIMGSTLVSLLSQGPRATVLWAGDSRAYRLRGGRLEQLTRDHSRIQELIDKGEVSPAEAENHPDANVITRALGVVQELELDSLRLDVRDGDTFLLCSDGLHRYVPEPDMQRFLAAGSCELACSRLMQHAMESPARDNITAIVIRAELDDTAVRTTINPAPGERPRDLDDDPTVLDDGSDRR